MRTIVSSLRREAGQSWARRLGGMPRPIVSLLLTAWFLAAAGNVRGDVHPAVLAAEESRLQVVERICRSTIAVFGVGDAGGGGSAVVVSADGYALTNFHVTKPIGDHLQCGLNDGRLYDAVIVGVDPTGDVGLIKLLGRDDFPAAELGDSDLVQAGDWCLVVGNPFLLATDFQPTVTYGIISGVHRYQYPSGTLLEYADCIQTDASINPGNSGGPLFNAAGKLIGINGRGSFEKRGRVNVGVGYAISINQIKNFLGSLRSGRVVDHATLGATVATDPDGRVVVTNILTSSDAYRRGLRYGDELLSFGGRSISSANGFKNALGVFPQGWRVPLSYRRDGQRHDVFVRLAGVHRKEELLAKLQLDGIEPPEPRPAPKPDDDRPRNGRPQPDAPQSEPHSQSKTTPPEIAKLIVPQRGFANYYFNLLERDRVWRQLLSFGQIAASRGVWLIEGQMQDARPFQLEIGNRSVSGRIGNEFHSVNLDDDPTTQLAPRDSGGLLLALHQWRRLLLEGPEKFGDVYYLGAAPLPGHDKLFDVLVATYDVLETHFYFDPETGALAALELYPDVDVDPCEIYFRDYESSGDRQMPAELHVVFGDETFGTLRVSAIGAAPAGAGGAF